jgi:hypothetical protein
MSQENVGLLRRGSKNGTDADRTASSPSLMRALRGALGAPSFAGGALLAGALLALARHSPPRGERTTL